MGKRKTALKKVNPDRHKAFISLRKMKNSQELFVTKSGAEIILNPVKRFLLKKDYINPEFRKELVRKAKRFNSLLAEKVKEVEKNKIKEGVGDAIRSTGKERNSE